MKTSPKSKTAPPVLDITDRRMLLIPDILKDLGIIRYRQEMLDAIGLAKQTVRNIRIGKQHFTAAHITALCQAFGVDANYIHGVVDRPFPGQSRVNTKVNTGAKKSTKLARIEK